VEKATIINALLEAGLVLRHPEILFLLLALPAYILLWVRRPARISRGALALRLLIATLLVATLADPVVGARPGQPEPVLALVIDQSDSLGEEGKAELRHRAAQAAAAHSGRVTLVYFGANRAPVALEASAPLLDLQVPGSEPAALPPPDPSLQSDRTDIAAALDSARMLIGPGGGRIALFSDALPTDGESLAAAAAAGEAGIPIDTDLYIAPDTPEVWLQGVEAPTGLREGEDFEAEVLVGSTAAGAATLRFTVGADQRDERSVTLVPGENRFRYAGKAGRPGILIIQADVAAGEDTILRNNIAATTALVAPAPRILIVEGQPAAGLPLELALQPLSINTDLIAPADLPNRLSALERYESVVLLNVPAADMTLDQMATLREFVRSEGRGLVATGGKDSFTLGAYKDTPLEQALPVQMTPPQRGERPDIDLLLIIDQSASMGPDIGDSKFNMAKESAILASESLRENDRIGVLSFDIGQEWVISFQPIGAALSLTQLQEQITNIPLGGGTDILGALQIGLPALSAQPGPVRHAVLLTDGRSFTTNRASYRALAERMHAAGVTLSSIAIGSDADTELLRELAQIGGGRYHFAAHPDDIPRLTLLESEILRTEPQIEGEFRAELNTQHPTLRGFVADQLPSLQGYVATTIKPEAELVLKSPEDDPVLAAWQYGLGRAVAWTPGAEAPWATSWSNWPEYGRFFAQLIRYTLPEPDSGPLQVRVTERPGAATIAADVVGPGGEPLDLADVQARLTLPDGSVRSIGLRQIAPGRYTQDVTLPAEGAYAISVEAAKDDLLRSGQIGYVRGYPAEYRPLMAPDGGLYGQALLDGIQAASRPGGESGTPPGGLPDASEGQSIWPWLLLAAVLLWPLEVAVRRGWLRI
jgi:Ca-activated chloride channel family protein